MVLEGFGDFGVDEFEETGAALDEGYFDAQEREHGSVFGADYAATYDDYGAWDRGEAEDFIAGEDVMCIEFDVGGARGCASDGDNNSGSGDLCG